MTGPATWLESLPRPEVMAIGDSLLNGMRSYSINDTLAKSSIPALVGRARGRFQPAEYPRDVLFNLETGLAHLLSNTIPFPGIDLLWVLATKLNEIKSHISLNAKAWMEQFRSPESGLPNTFDNIAIAGATGRDVFETTYGRLSKQIDAISIDVNSKPNPLSWGSTSAPEFPDGRWSFSDVHIKINSRHLLNPNNRIFPEDATVADIAAMRRPRVLIFSCGANNGFVDLIMRYSGAEAIGRLHQFAREWPAYARSLRKIRDLEALVVLQLPLPSQTPVLAPARKSEGNHENGPPVGQRYFDSYVSAFTPIWNGEHYTGDAVRNFDREISEFNRAIRDATAIEFRGSSAHIEFIDLGTLLGRYDYKHRRGAKLEGDTPPGRSYSNFSLAKLPFSDLRGGICGYDHIHPSEITYRVISNEIVQRLRERLSNFEISDIDITDRNDAFLLRPHWLSIGVVERLYPFSGRDLNIDRDPSRVRDLQDLDRLLFRPDWFR